MQRGVGLSKFLTMILVPVCIWGLVSALLLHLIEVRSIFIAGGENRLRLASLAFAWGCILVQRMSRSEGISTAKAYGAGLGVAIAMFSIHNAYTYRLPAPWPVVALVNIVLFAILAWTAWTLTAACSVDSEIKMKTAGETGILPEFRILNRRKKKEEDDKKLDEMWVERLPAKHPGRVILYFSLFALPAFGLGAYLFDLDGEAGLRLGALLFAYLWFALVVLSLASLGQIRAYFEKRDVTLPEEIGLTWISIGFAVVTFVMVIAFFLPQPESIPALFIRDRVMSAYRGHETQYGLKDSAGRVANEGPQQVEGAPSDQEARQLAERQNPGKGDEFVNYVRERGQDRQRTVQEIKQETSESFRQLVDGVLKLMLILGAIFGLVVLYAVVMSFYRGLSEGFGGLVFRRKRKQSKPKRKRKRNEPVPEMIRFKEFSNPFIGTYSMTDGNELVRYLWRALVAFCADAGSPCDPDQTPKEFVESKPAALEGFEQHAEFIAGLFTYSEFSGQPIPEDIVPHLQTFWNEMERHVRNARAAV